MTDPDPGPDLSAEQLALAAVRLAAAAAPGRPSGLAPADLAAFWRGASRPSPATPREGLLVYAVLYQIGDDTHGNTVTAQQVCDTLCFYGLPHFARRSGADGPPGTPGGPAARSHGPSGDA
ncbi:hypothetical protein [Kitasatospora phosalacinea]|uniref:Uncharacterized protein n=1 Tax=Kitasatospora phosalacinea TaxID=2065 RepID=A0ABW6GD41_9ACTN